MTQTLWFTNLIVTYNNANEISHLLNDLRQLALFSHSRVIVVDNGSWDQTDLIIRNQFPEVYLVQNSRNLGFAKAVNQGFELCDTECVFLLNPDMRILNPCFYSAMLACMQQDLNVAAVAPLQFKQAGGCRRLSLTWSHWSRGGLAIYLSHRLRLGRSFDTPIPTKFLNAGCLLIRRSAFMRVGKLSERYFLYGEEPDLFLKFMRYGYECRLHPGLEVTHYRERSLKTLPLARQCLARLKSLFYICDAVVRGCMNILLDRMLNSRNALSRNGDAAA